MTQQSLIRHAIQGDLAHRSREEVMGLLEPISEAEATAAFGSMVAVRLAEGVGIALVLFVLCGLLIRTLDLQLSDAVAADMSLAFSMFCGLAWAFVNCIVYGSLYWPRKVQPYRQDSAILSRALRDPVAANAVASLIDRQSFLWNFQLKALQAVTESPSAITQRVLSALRHSRESGERAPQHS